jgi:restriction endonuclease S subunit
VLSAAHQPSYVGRFVKQLDEEPDQPTSFVGELICLRPNPSILIPYYLFALLSSSVFQSLLNREKRGQTSHIYPYDIRQIMIPRPKFEVQQRIAEGVRQIRSKAKDLRQQGEAELYEAKRSIENIILGQGDN